MLLNYHQLKQQTLLKTWISKPDKDKNTVKNLVEELLISKNELLAARALQAAQDAEDWRLKKIRIMKQTRDEIGAGGAAKAKAFGEQQVAAAAAEKAAKEAAKKARAEAKADAIAEAKTNAALKKYQAKMRAAAAKKASSGGGAAGGPVPP